MARIPLIMLLCAATANAASFDCAKARTPQEKAICASSELSKADDDMADAFRKAVEATPPEMRDRVRGDQRQWLSLLSRYCPMPGPPDRDESPGECLLSQYQLRIKQLVGLVQHKGGVTFVGRSITLTLPEKTEDGQGTPMESMPGYATLTASWPEAASNAPEWQAWNKAILESAQHVLSSHPDPTLDGNSSPGWPLEEFEDNSVEVGVGTINPTLVTAHVEGTWGRGAHPSENYIELNWLLRDRRELRPEDVFQPGSGWELSLQKACEKYLFEFGDPPGSATYSPAGSKQLADAVHQIVIDPRDWQIDSNGISIVFPNYAVAPRAMHPGPVTIPWSQLRGYLQPGFVPPKG